MTVALTRRAVIEGALACAAAAAAAVPARGQGPAARLALVIGNSTYQDADAAALPSPELDAPKVAERLRALNFTTDCQVNLDSAKLRAAVDAFGKRLRAGGPDAVSFFYYAGHAAQDVEQVNYLLPIDAVTGSVDGVRTKGTPMDRLLDAYEEANNPVNVLVIDACRDWFARDASRARPRGLYEIKRRGNVGIAMATAPGMTAAEGNGESSPYTARLIEALATQAHESLSTLFDDLNSRVRFDTDHAQLPDYLNSLSRTPRWRLAGGPSPSPNAPTKPKVAPLVRTPEFLRTLDRSKLVAFTRGRESFVDVLLSRRDLLAQNEIDTPQRLAHFLAETAYQTAGFRAALVENLNYRTPERLQLLFPRQVPSVEVARKYIGSPDRIANLIYANRMGNGDEASGDGWRYRGRGYLQVTGRATYRAMGAMIGVDLEREPELMSDPEVSLAATAMLWRQRGANAMADAGDVARIARTIEGAARAIEERRVWLAAARTALGLPAQGPVQASASTEG